MCWHNSNKTFETGIAAQVRDIVYEHLVYKEYEVSYDPHLLNNWRAYMYVHVIVIGVFSLIFSGHIFCQVDEFVRFIEWYRRYSAFCWSRTGCQHLVPSTPENHRDGHIVNIQLWGRGYGICYRYYSLNLCDIFLLCV